MAYEWKNKIVLITGAATAIGAAAVRILMDENVKHVAILDVNEKAGVSLQEELNSKYGNKVKFYKCDISDEDQLQGSFNSVLKEQGYIDVVVNNAGIMNDNLKSYKKMIEVNVTALCNSTIKAIEIMSKEKGGRGGAVINIASVVALYLEPLFPIYSGTKSAVLRFSNCIGTKEIYARNGVRVVALCFGPTDTPLLDVKNLGCFDKSSEEILPGVMQAAPPFQKPESAAQGIVDAYKQAESGSTWVIVNNKPAKDMTAAMDKAVEVMSVPVFE